MKRSYVFEKKITGAAGEVRLNDRGEGSSLSWHKTKLEHLTPSMNFENPPNHIDTNSMPNHLRRVGINPNRWYMIARSVDVRDRPVGREIWKQPVVLFRTGSGEIHALEDACAHRLVRLSHGKIVGGEIECSYHGWRFDASGRCVHIPHLTAKPMLPNCAVKSFPVVERYGFIWIFPGDPQRAGVTVPMPMAEWDDLNEICSVAHLSCRAHFSYLIENLMDMYHGSLHAQYQVWTAQALREVVPSDEQVTAVYDATTYYRIAGISSILQLFVPWLRCIHAAPLTVTYDYPNWRSTLGDDFKIFCLICPVNERRTDAYLLHYVSLAKFAGLQKAPLAIRRILKRALNDIARRLLQNLIRQDVVMIEQEQSAFEENPQREPFEVNRTIRRVQQLIRRQADGSV
jgi:phenylpropionate dioxygenase-like ring-hydroxylating dioxygenase large terminal subunit